MKRISLIIYILVLVGIGLLGYIFYTYSFTDSKEIPVNNNRIMVERMVKQDVFFSHIVKLMACDSLSIQERAQLLADSIPASEIENMVASWKEAELSKKDKGMLMSCLSEKGDTVVPSLSATDYEQIFSIWKTIRPDNEFLILINQK